MVVPTVASNTVMVWKISHTYSQTARANFNTPWQQVTATMSAYTTRETMTVSRALESASQFPQLERGLTSTSGARVSVALYAIPLRYADSIQTHGNRVHKNLGPCLAGREN